MTALITIIGTFILFCTVGYLWINSAMKEWEKREQQEFDNDEIL